MSAVILCESPADHRGGSPYHIGYGGCPATGAIRTTWRPTKPRDRTRATAHLARPACGGHSSTPSTANRLTSAYP